MIGTILIMLILALLSIACIVGVIFLANWTLNKMKDGAERSCREYEEYIDGVYDLIHADPESAKLLIDNMNKYIV